ncbi:MAG TPA: catalase family protein [Candidatus Dormibacteraeota bacterium]|nr:catalase family protein [Candidatus Dormibacteraeota bacterium]
MRWLASFVRVPITGVALLLALARPAAAAPVPNQEVIPPGESRAIATILRMIEAQVERGYRAGGAALRDAHAKSHGCVRARFTVRPGLPPDYRVAVFARPRSYDAWIRYSNGSEDIRTDSRGDGRGMAIKLLGVPGRKILPGEADAQTQDFLGINFPVFFIRNVAEYVRFFQAKEHGTAVQFFSSRPHEAAIVAAIDRRKIHDVLDERYFSMTPYELGDRYMKYAMFPQRCIGEPILGPVAAATGANYLRTEMRRRLAEGPACFAFAIQLQTDPATMPIEDPTIEWSAAQSPYVTVADIRIDRQSFDSPAQNAFCENLSYTPWHALPALRPVGGINRARRAIYDGISALRHRLNGVPRTEPTEADFKKEPRP